MWTHTLSKIVPILHLAGKAVWDIKYFYWICNCFYKIQENIIKWNKTKKTIRIHGKYNTYIYF